MAFLLISVLIIVIAAIVVFLGACLIVLAPLIALYGLFFDKQEGDSDECDDDDIELYNDYDDD